MRIDNDIIDWLFGVTRWWLSEFTAGETLVLPEAAHFPAPGADNIFAACTTFAGVGAGSGWHFELIELAEQANPLGRVEQPATAGVVLQPETRELAAEDFLEVTYLRAELESPQALIASFATSIAHYLLYGARTPLPGGDDTREAVTDLCAVLLGFGIFKANAASEFTRFQDGAMHGWKSAQRGALGEDVLGYAVAMFVALAGDQAAVDEKAALKHLDGNPRAAFKWALKDLAGPRKADLEKLRAIEPHAAQAGPYR